MTLGEVCCIYLLAVFATRMPLNPFAREYVPNVGKQTSLLSVTSSPAAPGTSPASTSAASAQTKLSTQPVGSARCPTPAAEALEDEELQFEDVFEVEAVPSPPSPRSHLSPASPGGLSMVCTSNLCICDTFVLVVLGRVMLCIWIDCFTCPIQQLRKYS